MRRWSLFVEALVAWKVKEFFSTFSDKCKVYVAC